MVHAGPERDLGLGTAVPTSWLPSHRYLAVSKAHIPDFSLQYVPTTHISSCLARPRIPPTKSSMALVVSGLGPIK